MHRMEWLGFVQILGDSKTIQRATLQLKLSTLDMPMKLELSF